MRRGSEAPVHGRLGSRGFFPASREQGAQRRSWDVKPQT